ncbi:MAG: hypothetical protein BWX49_02053 [Bacteroidetes bacterium ADurb.Bin008]|jgi:hypothetical protein|nr:MAG: hypothetical protein BWX49_02053 [Bacteroidetes bacterium ADurb.Bin008]
MQVHDFKIPLMKSLCKAMATIVLLLCIGNHLLAQDKPKPKPKETKTTTPEKQQKNAADKSKKQQQKKTKFADFSLEIGISSTYDDNILKYSDKYLNRFLNREDEGRFQINTYDDLVLKPSIKLSAKKRIFGKQRSEFDLRFNHTQYAVNPIKNWDYLLITYRQVLPKKRHFRLSYSYIPNFYIRHFRDDDWVAVLGYTPETFKPMSFSKHNYGFWFHNTFFKNTGVRFSFDYSKYYYNTHYIEYDSDDFSYALTVFQPLGKSISIQPKYSFTSSIAKGYDMPGEKKETSDDSDAQYFDHTFSSAVRYKLPKLLNLNHSISVEGRLGKRYFTSKKHPDADPYHAGRIDVNYYLAVSYSINISQPLNLSINYTYYKRNSDTMADNNRLLVAEEKGYSQNQIGLSFTYNFNF